jgi:hypothetical protein
MRVESTYAICVCGRGMALVGTDADEALQRKIDFDLRPRSAECTSP